MDQTLVHKKSAISREWISVAVLIIIHLVGLWGLGFSNWKSYFLLLTPLNLLVSNILLFAHHKEWNRAFISFAAITFLVGMLVEIGGVQKGWLFGEYVYSGVLGLKVLGVPLMIGVNWLMLIYCTGIISDKFKLSKWAKAVISASLMVIMDLFIEPVAIALNFWQWAAVEVPLSNYIAWWGISFVLALVYQYSTFNKQNPLGFYLFIVQLLFFGGLGLLF